MIISIYYLLKISLQAVLSLCCKTSWIFIECESHPVKNEFKKNVILACRRSATLLKMLYRNDLHHKHHKCREKIKYILKKWSVVKDRFEWLPAPEVVVRTWVKVTSTIFLLLIVWPFSFDFTFFLLFIVWYATQFQCKGASQVDKKGSSPTLFCVLSSLEEIKTKNMKIILEQVVDI